MTKPTKEAKQTAYRARLKMIEAYMLNGIGAKDIHAKLQAKGIKAAYGTIRNDIVEINKEHAARMTEATKLMGEQQFLARCLLTRQQALEQDPPDLRLVHQIDKDIAGLYGVTLTINDRKVTLTVEKARHLIEEALKVVFQYVRDAKTRELILADFELLDQENE